MQISHNFNKPKTPTNNEIIHESTNNDQVNITIITILHRHHQTIQDLHVEPEP